MFFFCDWQPFIWFLDILCYLYSCVTKERWKQLITPRSDKYFVQNHILFSTNQSLLNPPIDSEWKCHKITKDSTSQTKTRRLFSFSILLSSCFFHGLLRAIFPSYFRLQKNLFCFTCALNFVEKVLTSLYLGVFGFTWLIVSR